jgi:hypothetical protein
MLKPVKLRYKLERPINIRSLGPWEAFLPPHPPKKRKGRPPRRLPSKKICFAIRTDGENVSVNELDCRNERLQGILMQFIYKATSCNLNELDRNADGSYKTLSKSLQAKVVFQFCNLLCKCVKMKDANIVRDAIHRNGNKIEFDKRVLQFRFNERGLAHAEYDDNIDRDKIGRGRRKMRKKQSDD